MKSCALLQEMLKQPSEKFHLLEIPAFYVSQSVSIHSKIHIFHICISLSQETLNHMLNLENPFLNFIWIS